MSTTTQRPPTRRRRFAPTDEQRAQADARRARFRDLVRQVAAMTDADREALAVRMAGVVTTEGRSLSVHNSILLACQRPSATIVGGFQQWRGQGRHVRKGEHGLMIWAPVRRADASDAPGASEPGPAELDSDRPRFVMVSVFDVGQTEAQPVPGDTPESTTETLALDGAA